jgi:hypothetical protein
MFISFAKQCQQSRDADELQRGRFGRQARRSLAGISLRSESDRRLTMRALAGAGAFGLVPHPLTAAPKVRDCQDCSLGRPLMDYEMRRNDHPRDLAERMATEVELARLRREFGEIDPGAARHVEPSLRALSHSSRSGAQEHLSGGDC